MQDTGPGEAGHAADHTGDDAEELDWEVYRHMDPHTGVVAEVRADGVPVGLALPRSAVAHGETHLATVVLRALTAAAGGARELLEAAAEEQW